MVLKYKQFAIIRFSTSPDFEFMNVAIVFEDFFGNLELKVVPTFPRLRFIFPDLNPNLISDYLSESIKGVIGIETLKESFRKRTTQIQFGETVKLAKSDSSNIKEHIETLSAVFLEAPKKVTNV